ncbi:MAG TPA: dihydroorotate dehydrogenase-like protein [Opitutus sp.]|nr:dihydroorotate dehydrogenase-like protein [Opitutus sp.]
MNLSTTYLGLPLRNPLVVGASPLSDHLASAVQLEQAGAAAIVMRSLFEEQIALEQRALVYHTEASAASHAEATSYFPAFEEYQLAPDRYLHQLERLKATLSIPVIASLNGNQPGGWLDYARRLESAGADALELNLYQLVTDPTLPPDLVETALIETVRDITASIRIPVAVKISPFHSALPCFAQSLQDSGAAGIVLFNRFYQPDFNLDQLDVQPSLHLSDSSELLLRLRWLAILSPQLKCSLAATGGVHTGDDVVKALLAGAAAVQVVSVLLKNGPQSLASLLEELQCWMAEHDYESIAQLRGALNHRHCPDPAAFERANYLRILQSWKI